jgi:molybdate transport system substrate-binding protein
MRLAALVLLLVVATVLPARADELTVSVAVSMKDAVEQIGRLFAKERPGLVLHYNVGASGDLQKQIEAGAPVDVFVSAGERQMDELAKAGRVVAGTRRPIAGNALVAIAPTRGQIDVSRPPALLDPRVTRIAIGNPKTVPAGQYAEQMLRGLGLWDRIAGKLIFAENVRQVLDYVSRGEVDVGFVYATDAATGAGRVREVFRPLQTTYRPIVYPAAVTTEARNPAAARAFVDFLAGDAARGVFGALGFTSP